MTLTGPEYREVIKPWFVCYIEAILPVGTDFEVRSRIPECTTCHVRFVLPPPGYSTSVDVMVNIADMEEHSKMRDV